MSPLSGTVEIRPASPEDFPVIGQLARRIWRASMPGIISLDQIEYMLTRRYTVEAMRQAVEEEKTSYELLFHDGDPVAFAAHGPMKAESEWKLQQLYVLPEWQGLGLGGRLMQHVENTAQKHGRSVVVLTVNRNNHRARLAYEHRGYRIRTEAQFDIGAGFMMDDFVMERLLDG